MIARRLPQAFALAASLLTPTALQSQATYDSSGYQQDFNSLPSNPSREISFFTFSNNLTIEGWYSSVGCDTKGARASNGTIRATGEIYSWGSTREPDRALGLFSAKGFSSPAYLAVHLINKTEQTVDSLSVNYVLEQWRQDKRPIVWSLEYLIIAEADESLSASDYQPVPGSSVTSQRQGAPQGLDGNLSENQFSKAVTLHKLNWKSGYSLWLRWKIESEAESSAFGLDQLRVKLAEPES